VEKIHNKLKIGTYDGIGYQIKKKKVLQNSPGASNTISKRLEMAYAYRDKSYFRA